MVKTLQKLISFRSVTGNHKNAEELFLYVKKELDGLGLYFRDYEKNGFQSLIITTRKTKTPELWLQAHIDVVPGKRELFKAKIADGKLYGRGAYDMKFAVAAYITAFKELGKKLKDTNVGIMLTSDEEVGGYDGVGSIVSDGFSGKVCFLPDGGTEWHLEKMSKGVFQAKVISRGLSNHSSRPWLGKNAILKLSEFLGCLDENFPKEPCGDENHVHNTLNIGLISGGYAINQIPDLAEATIDIRFLPQLTEEKIMKMIEKAKPANADITIEKIDFASSFSTDIKSEYIKKFYEIAKKKYGIKQETIISHGSSDARFFGEKNMPVIITRPTGGGLHSDEEWIDLDDLTRLKEVLKNFILEMR